MFRRRPISCALAPTRAACRSPMRDDTVAKHWMDTLIGTALLTNSSAARVVVGERTHSPLLPLGVPHGYEFRTVPAFCMLGL